MYGSCNAVIGANYGDEGKGLYANFFAEIGKKEHDRHLTVRFNGGAQAGHTVYSKEYKKKHIFKHIGSGTFHGADTLLDEKFVVHPGLYFDEKERLLKNFPGLRFPKVYVHEDCLVTTPYEVAENIIRETQLKHGSCGIGFGATAKKNYAKIPDLRICDAVSVERIKEKLALIDRYFLENIDPDSGSEKYKMIQEMIPYFISCLTDFVNEVIVLNDNEIISLVHQKSKTSSVCFEGAQGLGLDMNKGHFPNVTYSNTGIKNILKYFINIPVDVHYVTRSFLTRHGNGFMENEDKKLKIETQDFTNRPNHFQGELRSCLLDVDLLSNRVWSDFSLCKGINATMNLHMTHGHLLKSINYEYIRKNKICKDLKIVEYLDLSSISCDEVTNVLK